ncbi:hypothetical protein BJX62DRAFT_186502 [Aspergillus germanicus]
MFWLLRRLDPQLLYYFASGKSVLPSNPNLTQTPFSIQRETASDHSTSLVLIMANGHGDFGWMYGRVGEKDWGQVCEWDVPWDDLVSILEVKKSSYTLAPTKGYDCPPLISKYMPKPVRARLSVLAIVNSITRLGPIFHTGECRSFLHSLGYTYGLSSSSQPSESLSDSLRMLWSHSASSATQVNLLTRWRLCLASCAALLLSASPSPSPAGSSWGVPSGLSP